MTSDEIIKAFARWDKTSGYCASIAFAYVGQKLWFDVFDFMSNLDESEFDEDEIQSLLGFINTNIGEEKKGIGGNIRWRGTRII